VEVWPATQIRCIADDPDSPIGASIAQAPDSYELLIQTVRQNIRRRPAAALTLSWDSPPPPCHWGAALASGRRRWLEHSSEGTDLEVLLGGGHPPVSSAYSPDHTEG
jgi:hypothetical protein